MPPKFSVHINYHNEQNYFFEDIKKLINFLQWFEFAQSETHPNLSSLTPSEYVRDLIRRDMERRDGQFVQDAILAGHRDLAAGRVLVSSGDFKTDMAVLDRK